MKRRASYKVDYSVVVDPLDVMRDLGIDPDENPELVKEMEKVAETEDGFDILGFHRQLGGFFYGYVLFLIGFAISLVVLGTLFPLILPYPDVLGYKGIVANYFVLVFKLFDVGTDRALSRFVPEYRVKDPKRCFQYIAFFVWWQMFTGLIQVSLIAWWIFDVVEHQPDIAYLTWIFIIASAQQYPGMLGVFGSLLNNFQHYSKANLLSFLRSTLFDTFAQIGGAIIGRIYGMNHPVIGEMYGMAIGYILGDYLAQFVGMGLGAWLLSDIFKKMGYGWTEAFNPNIPWEVAKESLLLGAKTLLGTIWGTLMGFLSFLVTFSVLPQYAAWMGLINIANGIVRLVGVAEPLGGHVSDGLAEAYHNNKLELSHYLLATSLKWEITVDLFMGGFIMIVIPLAIKQLLDIFPSGENWEGIITLIPFMTMIKLTTVFDDNVNFTQMGHVITDQLIGIIQSTLNFIVQLILVYVIKKFDIWIYLSYQLPVAFGVKIFRWWYIHTHIFPIRLKDFAAQLLIPTFLALFTYMFILYLYVMYLFPIGAALIGGLPFALITVLLGLTGFPVLYFILYSAYGGYDDASLRVLELAVPLSGPSKFITKIFYKSAKWVHMRTPLANRFPIRDAQKAQREADELLIIKRIHAAQRFLELKQQGINVEPTEFIH